MNSYWLNTREKIRAARLFSSIWIRHNWPYYRGRLYQYALLMRMHKPVPILLLLWPTLWALWIAAEGSPTFHLLLVFIFGVFLTRSAGCVINDYADRNIDIYVERTRDRPITTGKVAANEAFTLIAVLLILAFMLVLTTNRLTILLSFIALPLAGVYPFMKRYTYIPQLFLGLAFGWGIPMAFAAVTDKVPAIAWLLYVANILWALSYDTMYAMVDREYDKRIGVKSTAILFDDSDRFFIGLIQIMMLLAFVFIGDQLEFSRIYYISLIAVAGFITYHQYLIKDRLPDKCLKAFLNSNWIGAVVFAGIVLHYYKQTN